MPWSYNATSRIVLPRGEAKMIELKVRFGENLRSVRKANGFSQEQLAFASGLDRSYVGKIERGQINVTLETVNTLAKTLGCSPKDLIPEE
jgi:transcriptional regulator with XRE-family HTH domain